MAGYWKRIAEQILKGLCFLFLWGMLSGTVFYSFYHDDRVSPSGWLALGYYLSLFGLLIGWVSAAAIFNSRDALLVHITPLTTRLLRRQNMRNRAGVLLMTGLVIPALILAVCYGSGPFMRSALHPLAGINLTLTYCVLLLYPVHMKAHPRSWMSYLFFFALCLLRHLYLFFFVIPGRRLKGFAPLWFLLMLGLIWHVKGDLLSSLFLMQDQALAHGLPGKLGLFVFAPVVGVFQFCPPATAGTDALTMLVILCVFFLIFLQSAWGALHPPPQADENLMTEMWFENREELEEQMEEIAEFHERSQAGPWQGNAEREIPAMEEAGGKQETPTLSQPGNPLPETNQLDYRAGLPAEEQIWRHHRYWSARNQSGTDQYLLLPLLIVVNNPLLLLIGFVILAVAAERGVILHLPPPRLFKVGVTAFAILILRHAVQVTASLGALLRWSWIIPLRWTGAVAKNVFFFNRRRLAIDLIWILGLLACFGFPVSGLLILPVFCVVHRLTLSVLNWLSANAPLARNFYLVVYAFSLIILISFALGSDDFRQDFQSIILGVCLWQIILLLPAFIYIGWRRLRADFQVVSDPKTRLIVLSSQAADQED